MSGRPSRKEKNQSKIPLFGRQIEYEGRKKDK